MLQKINFIFILVIFSVFNTFTLYGCKSISRIGTAKIIKETVEIEIEKTAIKGSEDTLESGTNLRTLNRYISLNKAVSSKSLIKKYKVNFSVESQPVTLNQEEFREFRERAQNFNYLTGQSYIKYKQELTDKVIKESEKLPFESQEAYKYLTKKISIDLPQSLRFEGDKILNKTLYDEFEKYYSRKLSTKIYQELNDKLSRKIDNKAPKTLINASLQLVADEVLDEFIIASFISNSLDVRIRKLINENGSLPNSSDFFIKDETLAVNKSISSFINKEISDDLAKHLNKKLIEKSELWANRGYKIKRSILVAVGTTVAIKVVHSVTYDYKKDNFNEKQ
ncbi:hypothetical protein [Nostoc sp.]|uniref:hypothetical protein n=1 Tax=Nostoc sp. TaxID=1180 RepID=UPI002FFB1602